jgi:G protein pathway suppressor 2
MTLSTSNLDKQKTAPVIHERPKMPRATWEALRHHIIKQRKRKQDEEGKAEEYERLKRERENKKKQEANSLEETKEQISKLEEKLTNLKEEKHQLFLTLKKVLNEDDSRRRKETSEMNILYPQHAAPNQLAFPLSGHMAPNNPQLTAMYLQPQSRQLAYMKPHAGLPPPMPPAQPIKRQRTPSPPRSSAYYRQPPVATGPAGRITASSVYGHPAAPASGAPIYATSGGLFAGPSASQASQAREEERRQQVYLSHQQGAR